MIEYGGKVYKLKGVDPHGNIPKAIRNEKRKNPKSLAENFLFHSVGCEGILFEPFKYSPLSENFDYNSNVECGRYYQDKPFGVMELAKAKNEILVCEKISDYLECFGFNSPYRPVCYGEFENLFFNSKKTSSVVLEIPSLGSDLRLCEFQRIARRYNTEPEKTFQVYKKIAQWNGFSTRIHEDLNLSPTDASLGNDNYILARISGCGIGLIKNDLSSTKIDSPPNKGLLKKMQISDGHFIPCQKEEQTDQEIIPKLQEVKEAYDWGLKNIPEPIPENEIMALFKGAY